MHDGHLKLMWRADFGPPHGGASQFIYTCKIRTMFSKLDIIRLELVEFIKTI